MSPRGRQRVDRSRYQYLRLEVHRHGERPFLIDVPCGVILEPEDAEGARVRLVAVTHPKPAPKGGSLPMCRPRTLEVCSE